MFRPWLELARISNLPTVWTNVLGAWLLVGGKWDWQPLAWLIIGASLLYTGGMILNDAADVKFDQEHRKERPIPSGRVSAKAAWSISLGMMAVGFAMMVWGAQACIWLTSALVAAILFYDLYHKPWAGSVFVMGSCRTLLYLAAASAAVEHLNIHDHLEAVIKAIALGGYVVGLSLFARREAKFSQSAKALTLTNLVLDNIPSVLLKSIPINTTLLFMILNITNWMPERNGSHQGALFGFYEGLAVFLVCNIFFRRVIDRATKLMRTPPPSNIGRAVGLLLAAIPLVDALAISSVAPVAAVCFTLSVPLLLLWQRKIAAT